DVPVLDRAVVARGKEMPAVAREGEAGDAARVAAESPDELLRVEVPQEDVRVSRIVLAARQHLPGRRTVGDDPDAVRAALPRPRRPERGTFPRDDSPVITAGKDDRAFWARRHRNERDGTGMVR